MISEEDRHYMGLADSVLAQLGPLFPSRLLEQARAAREPARLNIFRAIGTAYKGTRLAGTEYPISTVYPSINRELAARLVLNLPVGEGLTASERHEWLLRGAKGSPHEWLLRGTKYSCRCVAVARWILAADKSALRRIEEHLDDLLPEDVAGNPGVREVEARREARMVEDEFGAEPLAPLPRWMQGLSSRVRALMTGRALANEGRQMAHCVGGYVRNVQNGAVIVRIYGWGHRATAEFDRNGKLVQIKGKANSEPHPVTVAIAKYVSTRAKRMSK